MKSKAIPNPNQRQTNINISTLTIAYEEDIVRDRAVEIIENYEEGDAPMYIWLAFHNPHTPLQVPDSYLDLYPDEENPDRRISNGAFAKSNKDYR